MIFLKRLRKGGVFFVLHSIFDRMAQTLHRKNIPFFIIGLVAGILVAVTVIRILNVTITHDEALSYHWYVTHSYHDIITNHIPSANNHFLNSVLSKFFIELFADNVLFLRLPNLLAYIAYLLLSILIARKLFSNNWWVLFCFLLLQLNPFMFEFWGLSRGYGLSISFMSGALYALLLFLQRPRLLTITCLYICMLFAVFSNFALLNVLMAFSAIIFIYWLQYRTEQAAARWLIWAGICTGLILLAVYEPVRILVERDQLYFGGELGFVQSTLKSLIGESIYLPEENNAGLYIGWAIVAIVLLSGMYWCKKAYREKDWLGTGMLLWLLLVIPACSTLVQHHLLGNKFLIERTALFFYPLFALYMVYTIYHTGRIKELAIIILLMLLSFNFIRNTNLSSTRTWEYNKYDMWLLERMIANKKGEGEIKIYLDVYFTPAFAYYIPRVYPGKFGYLEWHNERAYEWHEYDYCLVQKEEAHKIPRHFVIDTVFSRFQFHLYKRKD